MQDFLSVLYLNVSLKLCGLRIYSAVLVCVCHRGGREGNRSYFILFFTSSLVVFNLLLSIIMRFTSVSLPASVIFSLKGRQWMLMTSCIFRVCVRTSVICVEQISFVPWRVVCFSESATNVFVCVYVCVVSIFKSQSK